MVSIKEVRARVQKSSTDNLFTRVILRKLSFPLTYIFVHTPLSANHITLIGMSITIFATYLLSTGEYGNAVIGAWLCLLGYVFDCVDGEVARFKKLSSETGSLLDDMSYLLVEFLPIIGITFGVYKNNSEQYVFFAGFIALFSIMFQRVMIYRRYQTLSEFLLKGKKSKYVQKSPAPRRSTLSYLKGAVELIFTLRGFLVIMIVMAFFNKMDWFFYFYALAYFAYVVFHLWYQHNYGFEKFLHRSLPKE